MREQKNILNYGFLLALFLIGIISIFCENQVFVESINNLSIPIFLFTISTLLAKGNTYIRGRIFKSISTNKDLIDKYDNLLERYNVVIQKNQELDIDMKLEDVQELNKLTKDSLDTHVYLNQLYKRHSAIDRCTIVINVIAMISFAFCILSLVGVWSIKNNFACINVFSLALVFFDFFVYEDILNRMVDKIFAKVKKITDNEVKKINES